MQYREFKPVALLRDYVKCYYVYTSDIAGPFEDTVFPSGSVELIFNLGDGEWFTGLEGAWSRNPSIEFWGQVVGPLSVRSVGRNSMLGVRFFPHAAAYLVNDKMELFNNKIVDYRDLSGGAADTLHDQLRAAASTQQQLALLDDFLLHRIFTSGERHQRMSLVTSIMQEMGHRDFFDNIDNVASRHGITSRYLQKLFLQYTGLTPKLYSKINRFQNSLKRVSRRESSLTDIALDCGYFDQSHFIREFKSFTGATPSAVYADSSPLTVALAGK